MKKITLLFALILLAASCNAKPASDPQQKNAPADISLSADDANSTPLLKEPITDILSRITKKPFGIYITPKNSPVQPEKFSGYHTGTDFEIFDGEQDIDVAIYAVCDGKILVKRFAAGYGGILVQACELEGSDITIVYGHLKLTSIDAEIGNELTAGEKFAILGKGYSTETDDERKHLHLGIHKGSNIDIKGYVSTEAELDSWIDFENISPKK